MFVVVGVKRLLSSERAALCESGLATGGLAKDCRAAGADDDGLCVREDGGDCEATWTLDVHEEGSGSWDKSLWDWFVRILILDELRSRWVDLTYLELVLAGLSLRRRVEEIDCENL